MTATTISRIVWPRPALAGCVFCTIVRDTRGATLDHAERFNFFPASPLCSVTWVLEGDWHLIERPEHMARPWTGEKMPRLSFSGPQRGPRASWNPGKTFAVTVGFFPDALSAMTRLDLSDFAGRTVAAADVLSSGLLGACERLSASTTTEAVEQRLAALDEDLEAIWTEARPAGSAPIGRVKDWSKNLALRAVSAAPGRSARQMARRIKSWTGVSQRDLRGLAQSEQLFAILHEANQKGDVDWADLAAASGFADQAHMIRTMRQNSGFTPEQLRQRAGKDEAFWSYRLLGQYFSQAQP